MVLALYDRVQETSAITGIGPLTLTGAVLGYRTFLSVSGGSFDQHYYTITDQTASANWEVGYGEYDAATNIFTRTTVFSSSNGGALVDFTSGALYVFVTYPASRAVYVNDGQFITPTPTNALLPIGNGGTNGGTQTQGFANIKGFQITAGGTVNLSDGSNYYNVFTGSTASQARLFDPVTDRKSVV